MRDLDSLIGRQFQQLAGEELAAPPAEAVVRRGRQRRRRARGRAMAIAAAVVAITAITATQLAASPVARRPAPASHGHQDRASRALACPAAESPSLAAELSTHELPISTQLDVSPIALSADGSALYVQTTTPGFRGVAEESLRTGAILAKIQQLPPSYTSSQGGLGPADALVWTSTYATRGEFGAMAPVWMWPPRSRVVITMEPARQNGTVLSAPVFSTGGNLAAWELADGRRQEIAEANLDTERTDVIARGRLGPPVFVGNALVWSSKSGGQRAHLVAMNAATFPASQPIAVPAALRAATDPVVTGFGSSGPWVPAASLIASYGGATVYASASLTKLYYSPSPSQPARLLFRLRGDFVSPGGLFAGPGYVGWHTADARGYLASTTSFAVTEVINGTTVWGQLFGLGKDVVAGTFAPTKAQHLTHYHLISGSTIAALRCAAAR
jgi:hypothetical protein